MSSARGQANHALYLARILLAAWRRDLDAESVAALTLTSAYMPGVREHLTNAYGWFLLEITRPGALPAKPPRGLVDLPEIAEGKAVPGEVREFQQLEQGGWLGDMLIADGAAAGASSPSNLAVAAPLSGSEQASLWADQLQSLFDRMSDSLDEY